MGRPGHDLAQDLFQARLLLWRSGDAWQVLTGEHGPVLALRRGIDIAYQAVYTASRSLFHQLAENKAQSYMPVIQLGRTSSSAFALGKHHPAGQRPGIVYRARTVRAQERANSSLSGGLDVVRRLLAVDEHRGQLVGVVSGLAPGSAGGSNNLLRDASWPVWRACSAKCSISKEVISTLFVQQTSQPLEQAQDIAFDWSRKASYKQERLLRAICCLFIKTSSSIGRVLAC